VTIGAAQQFFLGASKATGGGGAGYQIERSLRFNSSDSGYLSRTPAVAGNRRTWTLSWWQKLVDFPNAVNGGTERHIFFTGSSTSQSSSTYFRVMVSGDNTISINNNTDFEVKTTRTFRDFSAWYNFVLTFDTTQTTPADRVKLYINGTQETTFQSPTYPSINTDYAVNQTAYAFRIGSEDLKRFFSGYLADIYFIDGQALTPSSFTEVSATTGQLIPKAYTGSYTGNSFWLKFSDNSALTSGSNAGVGKDYSGLGNYWNTFGLSVTAGAGNDSLVDTPTSYGTDDGLVGSVRGNYALFNALALNGNTLSNGNLDYLAGSANKPTLTTVGIPNTGKWYFEFTDVNSTGSFTAGVGTASVGVSSYLGADANGWGYQTHPTNAGYHNSGVFTTTGRINGAGSNTIVGVAIDRDAQKIWFSVNGTYVNSGAPASGANAQYSNLPTSGELFPGASTGSGQNIVFNAGSRAFAYTAPSGFKALCDTNLPAPVVAKPNTVFDVIRYTGNGSTQTIPNVNTVPTTLGFSPDLVWIKGRSVATNNALYDLVRGANKRLMSNATDAEISATQDLTAFNSDGFTLGTDGTVNGNSNTYVAWAWDAGSAANPTTINANAYSAGVPSITSSVRANASAGFSIVTFTAQSSGNATIGHGLGVEPYFIIVKSRAQTYNWTVYHKNLTSNAYYLILNSTAAQDNSSNAWNSTTPTSSVFTLGSTFAGGGDSVAYCFAPVTGYSSFGSYTGNGSSDGPFVYTGFRPRWVMLKQSSGSGTGWQIHDTSRNTYNVMNNRLQPSNSDAESTYTTSDFLSNGFKLRDSDLSWNGNGATYIYAAFAESPFQFSRAR